MEQSKTPFIIITVITLLILLGWGLYLMYANANEKWPFIPYEPPVVSSETHLYWLNGEAGNQPITDPEILAKRQALIEQAIVDAGLAKTYDLNNICTCTYNFN
jgi:hypothetical protein